MLATMNWKVCLRTRSATSGGYIVRFKLQPIGGAMDAFCARDVEGVIWRGSFLPISIGITNERERMHALAGAADAYSKALRKAIDPFPVE